MRLTRHLIASAIILVTNSSAWAATTNMDFPSYVSGYATLELSDAVLDTANIGAAQFSSVSPGVADLVDSQGSYLQASFSLPATALAYDDVTKEVLSLSTTGGYRVNAGNVAGITDDGAPDRAVGGDRLAGDEGGVHTLFPLQARTGGQGGAGRRFLRPRGGGGQQEAGGDQGLHAVSPWLVARKAFCESSEHRDGPAAPFRPLLSPASVAVFPRQ